MKKLIPILIIVLLVSLILVSTVFAGPGKPIRNCKRGYNLQLLTQHAGESASLFLNPAQDTNGDGYICAQYFSNGLHRHLDNFNSPCRKR
jgi:hypothetical protein